MSWKRKDQLKGARLATVSCRVSPAQMDARSITTAVWVQSSERKSLQECAQSCSKSKTCKWWTFEFTGRCSLWQGGQLCSQRCVNPPQGVLCESTMEDGFSKVGLAGDCPQKTKMDKKNKRSETDCNMLSTKCVLGHCRLAQSEETQSWPECKWLCQKLSKACKAWSWEPNKSMVQHPPGDPRFGSSVGGKCSIWKKDQMCGLRCSGGCHLEDAGKEVLRHKKKCTAPKSPCYSTMRDETTKHGEKECTGT